MGVEIQLWPSGKFMTQPNFSDNHWDPSRGRAVKENRQTNPQIIPGIFLFAIFLLSAPREVVQPRRGILAWPHGSVFGLNQVG